MHVFSLSINLVCNITTLSKASQTYPPSSSPHITPHKSHIDDTDFSKKDDIYFITHTNYTHTDDTRLPSETEPLIHY